MNDVRQIINLLEAKNKKKLEILPLPYVRTALSPAISKNTLDYHYGKLAKGYVERYNNKEGDPDFNEAGAFLHNILFQQFQSPQADNEPIGLIAAIIRRKFNNFKNFKKEFSEEAMKIQGSGWIYLSKTGAIKTIVNHEIRQDILLLIDWWEHAWALDYQANKTKYLDNQWKIINWGIINSRI